MSEKTKLVDKIVTQLKNNRIVAFLVVFALIVVVISGFTDAGYKLIQQIQTAFSSNEVNAVTLRSKPDVLSSEEIQVMLGKNNFYDKRWNPAGKGLSHSYQAQIRSNTVVLYDAASGLMWQKGGSILPMPYAQTSQYIKRLNKDNFAGFSDWRMPTTEEAMSLMEPLPPGGVHIDAVFQRGINFIWTSDHSVDGRVWVLYFYDGTITKETEIISAWVRVVR